MADEIATPDTWPIVKCQSVIDWRVTSTNQLPWNTDQILFQRPYAIRVYAPRGQLQWTTEFTTQDGRIDALNIVCNTTAFPNPRGIYPIIIRHRNAKGNKLTILNQDWIGPESSRIRYINTVAIKGNNPNIKLIILYFPVLCIIHPAKSEPIDMETLFGAMCRPENCWPPIDNPKWEDLTGGRCTCKHHSLEPHREVILYRKVAYSNQKVGHSDQNRDTLFEKERCKDWFTG